MKTFAPLTKYETDVPIFEMTKKSIRFYEKFYGYKHPFSKYDYVFCPEYNSGAMENPGCVTINDVKIKKG